MTTTAIATGIRIAFALTVWLNWFGQNLKDMAHTFPNHPVFDLIVALGWATIATYGLMLILGWAFDRRPR